MAKRGWKWLSAAGLPEDAGGIPGGLHLEDESRAMSETAPRSGNISEVSFLGLREVELLILFLTLISFAYFYQASDHNTAARFDLIRSLLEQHTVSIDAYCGYNTADLVHLNGHYYSNKAPGGSLTGIVPWIVSLILSRPFAGDPDFYWAMVTYLATILTDGLAVAITCILIYRIALVLGSTEGKAVAAALTLAFGTIMFPHATEFAGEPIATAAVVGSFYILLRRELDPWDIFLSGLLAGWGGLCDYLTILISIILAVYALYRLRSKFSLLVLWVIGATIVAGLLMTYDWVAFGKPFFLSYEAYMLPGSDRFEAQAKGFAGVTYPHWEVLYQVLIGTERGLFFCNPVLLLTIPGLYYFWRDKSHRPEFLVVFGSIVIFTLVNGSYGDSVIYWGGGTATGPRHMLTVIPFMALVLVYLPSRWDYLFASLALTSVLLMLIATAVDPHLPYEYDNPLRDFSWPAFARGDFGYDNLVYFGGSNQLVGDAAAFNLGKLAGLPGWMQLWPLAAIWIAGAVAMLRHLYDGKAFLPKMETAAALAITMMFAPPAFARLAQAVTPVSKNGLLGRYYRGSHVDRFSPHLERVDKNIDFPSETALGSLPPPSIEIWRGWIDAPLDGTYNFRIHADDSAWLKIDNITVMADPGETITRAEQQGSITLTPGKHLIEVGHRNVLFGAEVHLYWQTPGSSSEELVPPDVLTPAVEASP
jgi:hypothetical protein